MVVLIVVMWVKWLSLFLATMIVAPPPLAEAIVTRGDSNDWKFLISNEDAPFFVSLFQRGDCAGTVVGNHHVLTAAHCVGAETNAPKVLFSNGRTGWPWAAFMNPDCIFSVANDGPNGCDVAVLAFEEDLLANNDIFSSSISLLPVYSGSDEVGKTMTIYGYGLSGNAANLNNNNGGCNNANDDGKFRRAQNIVTNTNDGVVRYRLDNVGGLNLEGMAQDGDSGGPATMTVDGTTYLIGANSGTMESNSCDYGSVDEYSRVSEHFEFISKILNYPQDQSICPWKKWKEPVSAYNVNCIEVSDGGSSGGSGGGGGTGIDDDDIDDGDQTGEGCYSPSVTTRVSGKGSVAMKDLDVGDKVLTVSGTYQAVYAIDHFHKTRPTEFLRIHTTIKDEKALEVTPLHMIYVEGGRSNPPPVPANRIRVGDLVRTMNHSGTRSSAEVLKIERIVRHGFYNVLTVDGTIVVDGVVGSTYSALSGTEYIEIWGIRWMSHQDFVHTLSVVVRAYHASTTVVLSLFGTSTTTAVVEKRDEYFAWYDQVYNTGFKFFQRQNAIVQGMMVVLFSVGLAILSALSWLSTNVQQVSVGIMVVPFATVFYWKKSCCFDVGLT